MAIIKKTINEEFHVCDHCEYDRGFHVSFEKTDSYEVVLICPGCGQRYNINWKVQL